MKKEATVHRLATEDVSQIHYNKVKYFNKIKYELSFQKEPSKCENSGLCSGNQHLYIISDKVVKKGDYYIHKELDSKLDSVKQLLEDGEFLAKKIIATTDPKLNTERYIAGIDPIGEDSVAITRKVSFKLPQISQSFIEEYCKAGGIDKILVEYKVITNTYDNMVDLMCPHSVAEYEQTTSSTLELKTDTNNCIIIHPVEDKMYSRDTFDKMLKECYQGGVDGVSWEEVAKRIKRKLIEIVEPKSE